MPSVNSKELVRFQHKLGILSRNAIPEAQKDTLNRAAFATRKLSLKEIDKDMVLRNKHTQRSVRVKQATRQKMESRIGSTEDYMLTQEEGGTKRTRGKHGVALATTVASGEGKGTRPRKRLARGKARLDKLNLQRVGRSAKGRSQEQVFKVQQAVASGNRVIFWNFKKGGQGIVQVVGGRKSFTRGWPKGAKLKVLWDFSHKSVRIPRSPWLKPSTDKVTPKMLRMYMDSLRFQLKKLGG